MHSATNSRSNATLLLGAPLNATGKSARSPSSVRPPGPRVSPGSGSIACHERQTCQPRLRRAGPYLLERVHSDPHAGVHVRLRRLQVVMEVVSERQDLQDGRLGRVFGCKVPREEDWAVVSFELGGPSGGHTECDIAHIVRFLQSRHTSEFQRGFTGGIEHLWGGLQR